MAKIEDAVPVSVSRKTKDNLLLYKIANGLKNLDEVIKVLLKGGVDSENARVQKAKGSKKSR